jgi:hypothetical protein
MTDYPRRENFAMVSTGDAEEDARQIDAFLVREKRLIEGICANGCGEMVKDGPGESHCPKCGFTYSVTGF